MTFVIPFCIIFVLIAISPLNILIKVLILTILAIVLLLTISRNKETFACPTYVSDITDTKSMMTDKLGDYAKAEIEKDIMPVFASNCIIWNNYFGCRYD